MGSDAVPVIISNQTISGALLRREMSPPILNEEIISMCVILSEKAANEVKRLITGQNLPEGTMRRMGVLRSRCSARSNSLNFDTNTTESDRVVDIHGVKVAMDKKFDPYLDGTVVDFYDDLKNSVFVFNNPNIRRDLLLRQLNPGLTAGCMMAMRDVSVMSKVRRQAVELAVLIDEWRQSVLSLPELCQRNGLSMGTMQNCVYKPDVVSQIAGLPHRSTPGSKAFRVSGQV